MHSFYYMKMKHVPAAALICFFSLTFILFSVLAARTAQETLADTLSPGILRFHVLANSNTPEDQALKQEVFQALLSSIKNGTEEEGIRPLTKENLEDYITRHRRDLEKYAETIMASRGFPYTASVHLEQCYFSTRQYGDLTFPCGTYDTVRVLLGKGGGKNWWCLLYPPLSFSGAEAVQEENVNRQNQEQELLPIVSESGYEWMTGKKKIVFGDDTPALSSSSSSDTDDPHTDTAATIHVKSKLWELLTDRSSQ